MATIIFIFIIGLILTGIYLLVTYLPDNTTQPNSENLTISSDVPQLSPIEEISRILNINQDFEGKMQSLWDKHDPDMGRIVSWWRRGKIESQNTLLTAGNEQERLLVEQAFIISDAVINGKKSIEEFNVFIENNKFQIESFKANTNLLKAASEKGLTLDTYDFEQRERIKFENEVKLIEQKVKWALVAKTLSSHQKVLLVQELLDKAYKQIEDIEDSPQLKPATKTRMIADRETMITQFKEFINAEGTRLLEAGGQQ